MDTTTVTQLPTLTGSDKQVAWAGDIRARFLDLVTTDEGGYRLAGQRASTEMVTHYQAWITGQTQAKFFIDHHRSVDVTAYCPGLGELRAAYADSDERRERIAADRAARAAKAGPVDTRPVWMQ